MSAVSEASISKNSYRYLVEIFEDFTGRGELVALFVDLPYGDVVKSKSVSLWLSINDKADLNRRTNSNCSKDYYMK